MKITKTVTQLITLLCFGALCGYINPVKACTLFAAAGSAVQGGTIIAKNRDYIPQPQEIRIVRTGKFAYLGLFSQAEGGNLLLRAGVNEKGLVAITAMASCLPHKIRKSGIQKAILSHVLKNCTSVQEALKCTDKFYGPKFVMLGDNKEIAEIEIGQNGKYVIRQTQNGTLAHTNFYLNPCFKELNLQVGESSKIRYERISQLLAETPHPLTLQKFYEFSQDINGGLDNSLWRFGSDSQGTQTLASFIVKISPDRKINAIIKYRQTPNSAGREKIVQFTEQNIINNKI